MPCFREIEVFLDAESELGRLPEFPHPYSPSVGIVLPDQETSVPGSQPSFSHSVTGGSTTRGTRISPRASVYILLLLGAWSLSCHRMPRHVVYLRFGRLADVQFWIHYSINQLPTPPGQIYFKLSPNGESITSWDMDPAEAAAGTVARGLYEPGKNWHYRDESERVFKQEGIQSRSFHFVSHLGDGPLLEDGDVMEVQIFRAKGRRRCTPRLSECKIQRGHGILYEPTQFLSFNVSSRLSLTF